MLVLNDRSQLNQSDLRLCGLGFDVCSQLLHRLLRIKLLRDAYLKFIKQVDDPLLDDLVVLLVRDEAEMQLVHIDLSLVVPVDVQHELDDLRQLCSRQREALVVQEGVDDFIFVYFAFEIFDFVFENGIAVEFLDALRAGLLKQLPHTIQHAPLALVIVSRELRVQALSQHRCDVLTHQLCRRDCPSLGGRSLRS